MKDKIKRIRELIKLINKEYPKLRKQADITFGEPLFKYFQEFGKLQHKINRYFCMTCGTEMVHYIPHKGRFKGQIQEYSWVCPKHPRFVMSKG